MSAGLALSPVASAKDTSARPSAQAKSAWSKTVRKTAEGGYVMGNPDAKIKLVEYASLTCGHCAHFDAEAFPALSQKYVDSGKVSYELRNYTLNAVDIPAALLTRCASPQSYFGFTNAFFENQTRFTDTLNAAPKEQLEAVSKLPTAQQFAKIADLSGMRAFFKNRGLSDAKALACLADTAAVQQLLDINRIASDRFQVEGTPTFILSGEKLDINTWPAIDKRLAAMVKG